MAGWDESKHKRGQPGNAGQFASNGGAARSKDDREKTKEAIRKYSDDPARDIVEHGLETAEREEARKAKENVPRAMGFADKTRVNTKHHQRHAREMGYKSQSEYEKAGCDFFNSNQGKLYYGIKRKRYYRYDEKTHELAVSVDGILHTYMPMSKKEFKNTIKREQLYE